MKTADPELMRAINRFHVVDVIRRHGPISRTEISARTELSAATISAITAALLEDELIGIRRVPAADGARGRPRVMLELNPDAAHVVGVKLAPRSISVAVTDFAAHPLASLTMPVRCERQPMGVVADIVEDGIRHCAERAGIALADIAGVCVGLPGVVDTGRGVCWRSPIFGPEPAAIGEALSARLGLDTRIESDANLATLAEHWFGRGREVDDFVVVAIEQTIGVGILHRGHLHRGGAGLSADLGWYVLEDAGNRPHLEDRAEGAVLGRAIANLASLLAPSLVILAGEGVRAGAALLGPLREAFREAISPALCGRIELVADDGDDDAWARGAAALVLHELYGAPWSTTGPRLVRPNGGGS